MDIHTSDNPAKDAGLQISSSIDMHDGDVICLLSGGSALDIIPYINIIEKPECRAPRALPTASPKGRTEGDGGNKPECRTIFMMGDERWSREQDINNSLQLKQRFLGHLVVDNFIATIPEEDESLENFATRVEKNFLKIFSELKDPKIISILGMGTDGHTAGIFPMENDSFQETYRDDGTYVPVHVEGLTIDSRASFTPTWIQNNVDEIFAFITGKQKQTMLESLINDTKELYERPAELIKRHKNAHLFTDAYIEPKQLYLRGSTA